MKRLSKIVSELEMSEMQEQAVQEVVVQGFQSLAPIFDFGSRMDGILGEIAHVLRQLQTPR
ncbi:MAG TPA: hypothetical protein PLB97_01445 [Accumulibacter sp.]|jgi:hypothetical protein|nr:hypothetical protein [Accumulibacter sp.]